MRARKQVRKFLSSIWVVGIFAAAATWAQNSDTPAVTHDSAQHAVEPCRIRTQDQLGIVIWKEPELTRTVVVRPDGKITLPLIGELSVVGLTPAELQTLLMEKLQPFLNMPKVTVAVRGVEAKEPLLPPRPPRPELPSPPPLWPFVIAETRAR